MDVNVEVCPRNFLEAHAIRVGESLPEDGRPLIQCNIEHYKISIVHGISELEIVFHFVTETFWTRVSRLRLHFHGSNTLLLEYINAGHQDVAYNTVFHVGTPKSHAALDTTAPTATTMSKSITTLLSTPRSSNTTAQRRHQTAHTRS